MDAADTTIVIQNYLDRLASQSADAHRDEVVRELLAGATRRLHVLCASFLRRSYPRLTRPPLNLQADEMLGAIVERLIKALREAKPVNVRQFFALANQHMRWELNDLARTLDERLAPIQVTDSAIALPESEAGGLSPTAQRILAAIDGLPEEEREVFDLVRIQGLTHAEVAELLDVATKTVQRRLQRGLLLLTSALGDLRVSADED